MRRADETAHIHQTPAITDEVVRNAQPANQATSDHPVDALDTPNKTPAHKPRRGVRGHKMTTSIVALRPSLTKHEMIWANVRGFSMWPGIIEDVLPNGKYNIHFFGDYTFSEVTKAKITHFLEGFTLYSKLNNRTKGLHKAVCESQLFLFEKQHSSSCFICKMLQIKHSMRQNQLIL